MNKLIKLFPFMPERDNLGKLALALLFYIGVSIVGTMLCIPLAVTVLLAPIAIVIGNAAYLYYFFGFIFSVLSFAGIKLNRTNQ